MSTKLSSIKRPIKVFISPNHCAKLLRNWEASLLHWKTWGLPWEVRDQPQDLKYEYEIVKIVEKKEKKPLDRTQ